MIRNLVLFGILISLIGLTFVIVEKREYGEYLKKTSDENLYDKNRLGELRGIELLNTGVVRGGDKFYTQNNHVVVNREKLDQVYRILDSIRARRWLNSNDISINESAFFSEHEQKFKFIFENGFVRFRIGHLLKLSEEFYLRIEIKEGAKLSKLYAVAYSDERLEGIFFEKNASAMKLNRILAMINLEEDFFYDLKVIPRKIKIDKVDFAFNGKAYSVDFLQMTTVPAYDTKVYKGVDLKRIEEFKMALYTLMADTIYENKIIDELREHFFTLKIHSSHGVYKLKGHNKYRNKRGIFLLVNNGPHLLEINKISLESILLSLDDFWLKREMSRL